MPSSSATCVLSKRALNPVMTPRPWPAISPPRATGSLPRPNGSTPAGQGAGANTLSATTPPSSRPTPGLRTMPGKRRIRSDRRPPMPGAFTTSTAMSPSGAMTSTPRTDYRQEPRPGPARPGHRRPLRAARRKLAVQRRWLPVCLPQQ